MTAGTVTAGTGILHATTVSVDGRGAILLGPSGSGKSGLALEMLALGAMLVADDRTEIVANAETEGLTARAPAGLPALIEARGIGLLKAPLAGPVPVGVVVDLGTEETARLPEMRSIHLLGRSVRLLHRPATPYFAASLFHYVRYGRSD